jgi:hypothetical protein
VATGIVSTFNLSFKRRCLKTSFGFYYGMRNVFSILRFSNKIRQVDMGAEHWSDGALEVDLRRAGFCLYFRSERTLRLAINSCKVYSVFGKVSGLTVSVFFFMR